MTTNAGAASSKCPAYIADADRIDPVAKRHDRKRRCRRWLLFSIGLVLLQLVCPVAASQTATPSHTNLLRPPDTSSPAATLESFSANLEKAYAIARDRSRPKEDSIAPLNRAARTLNLSEVPKTFAADVGTETALLLKEILDRVGLPPLAVVPDAEAVDRRDIEKWRIPNTEITIARVAEGPRAGEFLFTPATVARVRDDYLRVLDLPYGPDATPGLYDAYISTPGSGLSFVWGENLPSWLTRRVLDQTAWQWLTAGTGLALGLLFFVAAYRAGRRMDEERASKGRPTRAGMILALSLTVLAVLGLEYLIDEIINFTGTMLVVSIRFFVVLLYALLSWLAALVFAQIAETIIRSRRLRPRGIDSQLLRIGFRLLTVIAIAALVIDGAQRIGLPAYSVITGLGVGGLAVALAARETLANLFGSLAIMLDRPFRIGDWIKLGESEGTVEDIGFRSTRIRTFYDSLLSVPNSLTVNAAIDNMGQRTYRRVYTTLGIRYDTPPARIEAFLEGIKEIIRDHPATRKDVFHVVLNDLGAHSIDVMLYFFLEVPDWAEELVERQRVLLDIVRLADRLEVRFAFPTRSIEIDTPPDLGRAPAPPPAAS
ncbi:MAG: mechanosensitive ion channel family protein [Thiohalocapsa sp.]|nr:mechanosensitive ion channel family protein [Thiohalocapsa sp.]